MLLLVKDLAKLINLSLPLAGNILSRVVLYNSPKNKVILWTLVDNFLCIIILRSL
jgi:F0F1-type ATP synthase membrane subunit a